jgi:hypothetical protein
MTSHSSKTRHEPADLQWSCGIVDISLGYTIIPSSTASTKVMTSVLSVPIARTDSELAKPSEPEHASYWNILGIITIAKTLIEIILTIEVR